MFFNDMKARAEILSAKTGLNIKVDQPRAVEAHSYWKHACECWLKELENSRDLSHLKKSAALFRQFYIAEPFLISDNPDTPPGEIDSHTRQCILHSPHYIIWVIIHEICDTFETHRTDRIDEYSSRLTYDFTHDLMVAVNKGYMNERSMHIALKGLFVRDAKPVD